MTCCSIGGRRTRAAHIYVVDIDGSNLQRIVSAGSGGESLSSPTWSPQRDDGPYRLAFARQARSDDGYLIPRLEIANADGSDRTVLTEEHEALDTEPAWAPDGRRIAFIRRTSSVAGDLWVVRADDPTSAHPVMVDEPAGEQRSPAWSPDGSRLAFVSAHEIVRTRTNWQVYSVASDGSGLVRHTSTPHEHGNPVWLKRSRAIARPRPQGHARQATLTASQYCRIPPR